MLLLSVDDIDADLKASANNRFSSFYTGMMGSGRIDALRMLMNVEGTPCITLTKGKLHRNIDLVPYLGDGTLDIKIRDNNNNNAFDVMSKEDVSKLDVTVGPLIQSGKLTITCNKEGHGFINVSVIVGGKEAGSDDKMGGRVTTKRIAVIVRDSHTTNGGWM